MRTLKRIKEHCTCPYCGYVNHVEDEADLCPHLYEVAVVQSHFEFYFQNQFPVSREQEWMRMINPSCVKPSKKVRRANATPKKNSQPILEQSEQSVTVMGHEARCPFCGEENVIDITSCDHLIDVFMDEHDGRIHTFNFNLKGNGEIE